MDNEIKCQMKEKRIQKNKTDMQGHPAQSANIVIPRTFRWTLTNETHANIHWWMKSIKTDYVNKKITIEVFDDAKGDVFNWLQALIDKEEKASTATLTHLDGCGEAISLINFSGLKIEEHFTNYDYGNSQVLTHKVVISYKNGKRVNQLNVQ